MLDLETSPTACSWLDRPTAALAARFVVDVACLSRIDGDLLAPLILTTVAQANQAALLRDAALQQQYGSADAGLPDHLRRPITINAVAHSLALPFETVRRRVGQMAAAGLLIASGEGLIAPQAIVTSAAYLAVQGSRVSRLSRLLADLAQAPGSEVDPALAGAVLQWPRAADRLLADYVLRTYGAMAELAPSVLSRLVLVAAWTHALGPGGMGGDGPPCTVAGLARDLGVPEETVRRHLKALNDDGLCRREPGGWRAVAPPEALERIQQVATLNAADLRQLCRKLQAVCGFAPGGSEAHLT
jgi:DNA-binding Lrp family transcriptional regulator